MIVEIIVPQGTRTVRVRDIPELFAAAIHPAPPADSPRIVTEVKKMATSKENAQQWCGANVRPFPVSLTKDDLSTLYATCWLGLPPLELPIPLAEWSRYQTAFDQSPHDGWIFFAVSVNPVLNWKVMQDHLVAEYLKQITSAARSGELTVRSADTLLPCVGATGDRLLECLVSVDDLRSYAATLQFEMRVSSSTNIPAPARPEVPANGVANVPVPTPPQPVRPSNAAEEAASPAGKVAASTRPESAATPAERRAQLDLTRERGARRRILERWNDIEKEYGRNIDARNVHRVLKREQGEDDVALKTIQNHLSALKKEGLIP